MLWEAIDPRAGVDVVLDGRQEEAYTRLADRTNRLWTYGSHLYRFLY